MGVDRCADFRVNRGPVEKTGGDLLGGSHLQPALRAIGALRDGIVPIDCRTLVRAVFPHVES